MKVTYFNRKLFPDIEMLGGYKPFVPPLIEPEESSDIISSTADLIPFALYDLKMQGRWKRLYTTQRDGLSFNRIAHHVCFGNSLLSLRHCLFTTTFAMYCSCIVLFSDSRLRWPEYYIEKGSRKWYCVGRLQ